MILKQALITLTVFLSVSSAVRATEVGRVFRALDASESRALATAAETPVLSPTPEPSATPVDRETLAAIMKHPTEPHYDLLRPMSGRWVSCRANGSGSTAASIQDRFSSSDRSHFTHTMMQASDTDCKAMLSERRKSYECTAVSKEMLTCKVVKTETKSGEGATWTLNKPTDADAAGSAVRLILKTTGKKKKTEDRRKLELRFMPDGASSIETYALDFQQAPRPSSGSH